MVEIQVRCPQCSKKGIIEIDKNIITKNIKGITAVNIGEDFICEHSLVVYVDKNNTVRDCFTADFIVNIPDIEVSKEIEDVSVPTQEQVDIYLLTMNLSGQWLAYIIRACINNKKVLILNDLTILNNHILNFFNYIFKGTFDINIDFIEAQVYKKEKKKYKDCILLNHRDIIHDKSKMMREKSMKIENLIIQKFLKEGDPQSSLLILRNEIIKAHELTKTVHEYVKNQGENTPLDGEDLNKYLKKKYNNVKFNSTYVNYIVSLVKVWHDVKIIDASHHLDLL